MQYKRFKEFERDPRIQQLAGSLQEQMLLECEQKVEEIQAITCWPFAIIVHPQPTVQYAVYDSPKARDWQIFRIALKGLTTRQKLYQLRKRYREMLETIRADTFPVEQIQIDNYIGALQRGGQLMIDGRVVL